jgi:hypothetical protein
VEYDHWATVHLSGRNVLILVFEQRKVNEGGLPCDLLICVTVAIASKCESVLNCGNIRFVDNANNSELAGLPFLINRSKVS